MQFNPWVEEIRWRKAWQPAPVFLPGESHGQRSLVRYSPWGHKESNTTEETQHTRMRVHVITALRQCLSSTGSFCLEHPPPHPAGSLERSAPAFPSPLNPVPALYSRCSWDIPTSNTTSTTIINCLATCRPLPPGWEVLRVWILVLLISVFTGAGPDQAFRKGSPQKRSSLKHPVCTTASPPFVSRYISTSILECVWTSAMSSTYLSNPFSL